MVLACSLVKVKVSRAWWAVWSTVAAGCFVNLARLDTNQPVFHVVHPADSVGARYGIQVGDQVDSRHALAVHLSGDAQLEMDLQIGRVRWCAGEGFGPGEGFLRWLLPGVFQFTRFGAATPQVFIDGEAALAGIYRQIARLAVLYLILLDSCPILVWGR